MAEATKPDDAEAGSSKPSSTEVPFRRDKKFVCIEYPGIVKPESVDNMIATLGGIEKLSATYANPTHRLELRYRPDDAFCKPAYGDRFNTTRVLLKVKRRRPKNLDPNAPAEVVKAATTYDSEIVGVVDHTYKFESMMDFQYLPMEHKGDGQYKSLVPELVPTKLEPRSWLQEEGALALTPIVFSRIDRPSSHALRCSEKATTNNNAAEQVAKPDRETDTVPRMNSLISRIRKRRTAFAAFVTYDVESIPLEANPATLTFLKYCPPEVIRRLREAFSARPIWSRNALSATLHLERHDFKFTLPSVAYYFISGPWRGLWVKFGYDPRKEVAAKIYQTLDFRVRKALGSVKMKNAGSGRSRFGFSNVVSIKFTSVNAQSKTPTIQKDALEPEPETSAAEQEDLRQTERYYKFQAGVLPPLHQMFYQLIDIEVDEVQAIVHANDGRETVCKMQSGWCTSDAIPNCRDIMCSIVRNTYEGIPEVLDSELAATDTELAAKTDRKEGDESEQSEDEQEEVLPSDLSDDEAAGTSKGGEPEDIMDT